MNEIIKNIISNFLGGLGVLIVWFIITRWKNIVFFITSYYSVPGKFITISWKYRWLLNHEQHKFIQSILVRSPIAQTLDPLDYQCNDSWEIRQLEYLENEGLISTVNKNEGVSSADNGGTIIYSCVLVLKKSFHDNFKRADVKRIK